ncbi:hypothetical protein ONE63_008390 [Megalurothrips usitatus]|uniref:ATP-dependent helicase ATRX n=1 Tax=Megalurothrips usitatus TaxID=439358 RepID=A0AAV7XSV7_9NEOP|nr:hypothetical protein ONE63_008390 [Megalurothrips usitatus]
MATEVLKSPPKVDRKGRELCIRVSEEEDDYRETHFKDVEKVLKEEVVCSICSENLKLAVLDGGDIFYHPHLKVLMCKECRDSYGTGEFSPDEDGTDKYCRWCGKGGSLFCCSKCVCSFCKPCIRKNFGRAMLKDLEENDFDCFICQPKPLYKIRAICYAAVECSQSRKRERSLSRKNKISALAERKALGIKPKRPERKLKIKTPPASDSETEMSSSAVVKAPERNSSARNECGSKAVKTKAPKVDSVLISDSSGDLTDSDFEPKSSQRFKPCLMKNHKKSNDSSSDHQGPVRVTRKDFASPKGSGWAILDSIAEDVTCVATVLNENTCRSRKNYTGQSLEDCMLQLAVTDLQRYIKSAVQSLLDLGESLDNMSTNSSSIVATNGSSDKLKINHENEGGSQSSVQIVEGEVSGSSSKSKSRSGSHPERSVKSCPSPNPEDSEDEGDSKAPCKIQRCGSTESECGADADLENSEKFQSGGGSDSEEQGKAADHTNVNSSCSDSGKSGSPNALQRKNDEMLEDNTADFEPSKAVFSENELSGDVAESAGNVSQDMFADEDEVMQSSKSLACKANLMASSSSDSEDELPNEPNCNHDNDVHESSSDSDTQPMKAETKSHVRKKNMDVKMLEEYKSDIKLQGKWTVDIVEMDPVSRDNYLSLAANYYAKSSSESDSDRSINNLTNLNNLKRKGNMSKDEGGSDGSSHSNEVKKKKGKKSKEPLTEEKKLVDFLNKSETSETEGSFEKSDNLEQTLSGKDGVNSLNEAKKMCLLQSSDSEADGEADADGEAEDDEDIKEDNASSSKPNSSDNKDARSSDNDKKSDSDCDLKQKKKSWRNDKLLTGKLSDTDTSDDEKKVLKKRSKMADSGDDSSDNVPIFNRKSQGTPKKKGAKSDSDGPSSSTSEDFVKKKRRVLRKKSSSSSSSESEKDKPKKKRRRIKIANSSSSSEAEGDAKTTDSPMKGRKKLRHMMREDDLEQGTKEAAKEEEERLKRIAARQKQYDELYDNVQKGFETLDKLVLDFDEKTKEPLVEVDPELVKKLKPHQAKGVKFMWDACFESLKMISKSKGSGCILAHCMGLGKTFQIVTLVHTLFKHPATKVTRVLVVCPVSTLLNWVNEFDKWLRNIEPEIEIFELTKAKQNVERSYRLKEWHECGGVMVIGYDMYRNLTNPESKRARVSIMKSFQATLVDPGPDLVICDEGHLLKNEDTGISKALTRVKTLRRIILTGTPLQNNLKEYHCMVQFVKPNLLGTKKEFCNRFVNPITNGQFEDSTAHDVKRMKRRAHVLHKTLEGSVQRFDYSVLTPFLPAKEEYVISVRLSNLQEKMYRHYLEHFSSKGYQGKGAQLFADFQQLQRIWTHPRVMKMSQERSDLKAEKEEDEDSEGSLRDFIDDGSDTTSSSSSSDAKSDDDDDVVCLSDESTNGKKKSRKPKQNTRRTRSNKDPPSDPEPVLPTKQAEWWESYVGENDLEDLTASPKLILLFDILRNCEENGEKLLVFSQSLFSLDVIEYFLSKIDDATQRGQKSDLLGGHQGSWSPGIDYFRLDGSTPTDLRATWCNIFNKTSNLKARLFLISTKAGGLGINLVAANRVVIFDASWNPSHDVQSIFRVYRFGQKKPCFIYRFLAQGTMEEKIYERQVTKLSLACRVVDELQIERYYKMADLQELYNFTPADRSAYIPPKLPKDHMFAEILKQHEAIITKYHEHDSLLENKEAEELNEEERKAAWEDYESEKKGPINQGLGDALGELTSTFVSLSLCT